MSCQVEEIADCGDVKSVARALYYQYNEGENWLNNCIISLSSCGSLLATAYKNRLCLLTAHWISTSESKTYLVNWSGSVVSDITALLAVPVSSTNQSSQSGPDWICIIAGFKDGSLGFYTDSGHLLLIEKLDEEAVLNVTSHTGTYGTLSDDIHVFFEYSICIISGSSLFEALRYAKAQLARVQAGIQKDFSLDGRNINIKKWMYSEQDVINDAVVIGLEIKNTYDHLLAASSFGGYDTWYRTIPPHNTLVLGTGMRPYIGFHYALEGGTTPPLQDVARAVANKIKSALPGWLGGGSNKNAQGTGEQKLRPESFSMRSGIYDVQRHGATVVISPDRTLAAVTDNLGRVTIIDNSKGFIIKMFKGCREAQCSFIQVFEQDHKKPQLATIKEVRRATFLVIYNPKKGLIDIRLMQRGNRVAVFTATKNGKLIYNTSGMLGVEPKYSQKKLNLPEYACVFIDPDGKMKRFTIPFFYALEGDHSQRSKDLHIFREIKEFIKKNSPMNDNFNSEIVAKISEFNTVDLKRHCLELLIRNHEVKPIVLIDCIDTFLQEDDVDDAEKQKFRNYCIRLSLVTVFYIQINDNLEVDLNGFISKLKNIHRVKSVIIKEIDSENQVSLESDKGNITSNINFHLNKADKDVLERLLDLAQVRSFKEREHSKVSFADNVFTTYKDFISSFDLDGTDEYVCLKSSLSQGKLNNLASDTFKSLFNLDDIEKVSCYVKESKIDPKDLVQLLIIHWINRPFEDINIDVIEKIVTILYYICEVSEDAKNVAYNEVSPWWQGIRDILVDMSCPLRSMVAAMACRKVVELFEQQVSSSETETWELVTKENAKWSILIGKLEDISILSIILLIKETFKGRSLPKLNSYDDLEINLKYIYNKGKGAVAELIAKWLCSMGVIPEAILVNELLETVDTDKNNSEDDENNDSTFIDNNRIFVEENDKIFKWFSLLSKQFPFSTSSNNIIANMCWEYASAWQKRVQNCTKLEAVLSCLKCINNAHTVVGICYLVWTTFIKNKFDTCCQLVNKVGRLPKDFLCSQDLGLTSAIMVDFLKLTTDFLEFFSISLIKSQQSVKCKLQFEKIWDESVQSLVEVAQDVKNINHNVLSLNYQISYTIYFQSYFNIKFVKPLNTLYDYDVHYLFGALNAEASLDDNISPSREKLRTARMKFLSKVLYLALELITCEEIEHGPKSYQTEESTVWIDKIHVLASLWQIDSDYLRRQQVIGLYRLGYDALVEDLLPSVQQVELLLQPVVVLAAGRLKRCLEQAPSVADWYAALPPHLVTYIQTLSTDSSPGNSSLQSTASVLQHLICRIENSESSPTHKQTLRIAELLINGCEILQELDNN